MLPTLTHGQVLFTRPARGPIAVGDVVVFTAAIGGLYVKRIAGMPGDIVTLEAGRLYVNGRAWDGGPRTTGAHVERWRVPDGHCFMVGDNLKESDDSRVWREPFVALARIGGVGLRRWPWRRLAADSNRSRVQESLCCGPVQTQAVRGAPVFSQGAGRQCNGLDIGHEAVSQAQLHSNGRSGRAVGGIVAKCKLEPKADAVRHTIIGESGVGTDVMAGKDAQQRPARGPVQVAKAVNDYADHFDHPGFKPIPNIH